MVKVRIVLGENSCQPIRDFVLDILDINREMIGSVAKEDDFLLRDHLEAGYVASIEADQRNLDCLHDSLETGERIPLIPFDASVDSWVVAWELHSDRNTDHDKPLSSSVVNNMNCAHYNLFDFVSQA